MRYSKRSWSFIIGCIIVASITVVIFATKRPVIKTMALSYAFDVTDTRRLVGWADNVFVGKVVKQVGTKTLIGTPETQFKVEVSDNIKGKFNGTVIVNQQGGFNKFELILIENDQLLQEGQSYLFVTKHLKEENWNTLVPVYGDILIDNKEAKKELIDKYTKAYKNEIPY
ncbi:hypothetical protein WMW72_35400 [Paenibacillus filicis]|uniref:Uncharacterized protein n=1 Tax=Paenibacillus filicis TaxID=669464 RepID=A0ABU9DWA3_9BACL